MSMDIDISEDHAIENAPVKQLSSTEMNLHPSQSGSNSTLVHNAKVDELSSGEGGANEAPKPETINEVCLSILGHVCRISLKYFLWFNLFISFSL